VSVFHAGCGDRNPPAVTVDAAGGDGTVSVVGASML
jgi:hypothetical protein